MTAPLTQEKAIKLIIFFGIVSLFADIAYEGARSISGQYLAVLGASGAAVGFIAGFGELLGYGSRMMFGYFSDQTKRYWLFTFIGYFLNLVAVPLLALAGSWPMAASLMILERFGKAIRTPSRDAMLSYATHTTGRGWGFGLHEALDQVGAILGPLLASLVLYFKGTYAISFAVLGIPAICALTVLVAARLLYPKPEDLEVEQQTLDHPSGFSKAYWIYILGLCCVAAGFVDFPLIAFHFENTEAIPDPWVPVFFSIAMAAAGLSALLFGKLYDKKGLSILVTATAITCFFAPLVFSDNFYLPLLGMILWGAGVGAQESILRAAVATFVKMSKRGTAYGILNACFGLSWFLGSALMGVLYDTSIPLLVIFSVGSQLAAIPFFLLAKNRSS